MAIIKGIKADIFKNTNIYFLKNIILRFVKNWKNTEKDKIEKKKDKEDNNKTKEEESDYESENKENIKEKFLISILKKI